MNLNIFINIIFKLNNENEIFDIFINYNSFILFIYLLKNIQG